MNPPANPDLRAPEWEKFEWLLRVVQDTSHECGAFNIDQPGGTEAYEPVLAEAEAAAQELRDFVRSMVERSK